MSSVVNSERIEARWREQSRGGAIPGLYPGIDALTTLHICPRVVSDPIVRSFRPSKEAPNGSGLFKIWLEGGLMAVKLPKKYVTARGSFADRGRVCGFSAHARRRLMRKLAMLKRSVLPLFVTMTYPGEFDVDFHEWKNDLHKFARRFARRFPAAAFVWRLEPQKRGAPHYHLLVYGVTMDGDTVAWFHKAWFESVKSGDEKHFIYGVKVENIRSRRGVNAYVSKYIAKKQGIPSAEDGAPVVDWAFVGRWWGVRYGHNLPESEVFEAVGLSLSQSTKLLRSMRRYLSAFGVKVSANLPGLTMFVSDPSSWAIAIDGLTGGYYAGNGSFNSIGKVLLQ